MSKLKIGSRDSALALAQTEQVMHFIRQAHPQIEMQVVAIKTTGDKILDKALDKIGGKGLFVKELDEALLDGSVDITVHSMKDLPMDIHPDLPIVGVSARANPCDALILPLGQDTLAFDKPVGCSSKRRSLQLQLLYPQVRLAGIRGNVQTRLRKLDEGEFSATLLACAGLERVGLQHRISKEFTAQEMLPASCQGILAVQARADFDPAVLGDFHCQDCAYVAAAERAFTKALNGGCSSPVAAFATLSGDALCLRGLYVSPQGQIIRGEVTGKFQHAVHMGKQLATQLQAQAKEAQS